MHHTKRHPQKVADDPKAKVQEERQRREVAIANTTGIRPLPLSPKPFRCG